MASQRLSDKERHASPGGVKRLEVQRDRRRVNFESVHARFRDYGEEVAFGKRPGVEGRLVASNAGEQPVLGTLAAPPCTSSPHLQKAQAWEGGLESACGGPSFFLGI